MVSVARPLLVSYPLHSRYEALGFDISIGDGCHCLVWFDPWLKGDPFLHQFSTTIVLNADSSFHAKIGDFLHANRT